MTRFDITPGARAVLAVKDLIRRTACELHGAATVEVPVDGLPALTRTGLDDPLAGIRAAVLARNAALAEIRAYAEQARGGGRTWEEVAEALGLDEAGFDAPPAQLAFGLVAENRPLPFRESFERLDAWWSCGSCGERVRDHGPFEANPADNETGHAPTCRRHAADIAAARIREGSR